MLSQISNSNQSLTSLRACQQMPKYQDLLRRFFDGVCFDLQLLKEDLPFIVENALKYWSGGLRDQVQSLSNGVFSNICYEIGKSHSH